MIAALWEKVQPYPSPFMSVIHASAQPVVVGFVRERPKPGMRESRKDVRRCGDCT